MSGQPVRDAAGSACRDPGYIQAQSRDRTELQVFTYLAALDTQINSNQDLIEIFRNRGQR